MGEGDRTEEGFPRLDVSRISREFLQLILVFEKIVHQLKSAFDLQLLEEAVDMILHSIRGNIQ